LPYSAEELLALPEVDGGDAPARSPQGAGKRPPVDTAEFQEAVDAYNADHRREYPRNGAECPACGHNGCFGTVPDTERWSCFSSDHDPDVGVEGNGCTTGDALDLDAFEAGMRRHELLVLEGYLKPWDTSERKRAWMIDRGLMAQSISIDDILARRALREVR
jgi:hypothetical protein